MHVKLCYWILKTFEMFQLFLAVLALLMVNATCNHHDRTNQWPDRSTIVHLFEWKWTDIAEECERFLAPKGFGGVQISPPSENVIIHLDNGKRPWYERYQVMSYKLRTRSGDENDFLNMTTRCNKVGVRVYVDVVFNHMTGDNKEAVGTGGSTADLKSYSYPAVPYSREHFHPFCIINNYDNASEVRLCELLGLKDLDQGLPYVREKITAYMNHLIFLGVAGFRVDAAKHMWPEHLGLIYNQLSNLSTEFGFSENTRPYIYQEVIYYGNEPIKPTEYISLGDVTEFKVGLELKNVFRGHNPAKWLISFGDQWGLLPSERALAFIDNHDTQRNYDAVLTYKEPRAYKAAVAFMLAYPYGEHRIMSSFFFDHSKQGPPSDAQGYIVSPSFNQDDVCGNGWVCEQRWRQIYQMVGFKNAVKDVKLQNWWDNGHNQIAFSRENKGFIAFNLESRNFDQVLQTGLAPGGYCDVITGKRYGLTCSGNKVTVDSNGRAHIQILASNEDMHLAIHVGKEVREYSKFDLMLQHHLESAEYQTPF